MKKVRLFFGFMSSPQISERKKRFKQAVEIFLTETGLTIDALARYGITDSHTPEEILTTLATVVAPRVTGEDSLSNFIRLTKRQYDTINRDFPNLLPPRRPKKLKPLKETNILAPLQEIGVGPLLPLQERSMQGAPEDYDWWNDPDSRIKKPPADFGKGTNNINQFAGYDLDEIPRARRAIQRGGSVGPRRKSFAMRRPRGMLSQSQVEARKRFKDPKWREDNLYGRRESLRDFLIRKPGARNMMYDTRNGPKFRVSGVAKGLLRSKRMRRKWWGWLEQVIPVGAKSITDLDAAKAMANYEHSRKSTRKVNTVKRENPF